MKKMVDVYDFRYIVCMLLHDEYGINSHTWELIEDELLLGNIRDVSYHVQFLEGRCYITDEGFARLIVP